MGNDVHCLRPKNGTSARLEPNCFKVRNVNESGHVVNKGYLEVTQTDLILHVVNAETVKWPLRCLRRYGHDANLFSFESGRRCATGPGIYAFKSKYAIQIFRLVQENAQHTEENATSPTTPSPTTPNLPTSRASRQRSLSNDTALPPSQTMSRASSNASGVNGAAHGVVANGSLSPHPSVSSNISFPPPTSPGPLYFNGNGSVSNCLRTSPISPTMQYMNSSAFGDIPESPLEGTPEDSLANGVIPEEASSHNVSSDSFGDPALNYARLKLPSDEDKNNAQMNTDDERRPKEQDGSDEEKEESRIKKNEEEGVDRGSGARDNDESGIVAELENSGENQGDDNASGLGCDSGVGEGRVESKPEKESKSREEEGKDSSLVNDLNLEDDESSKNKISGDDVKAKADVGHVTVDEEERDKSDVRLKVKKNGKREVNDIERTTALLQDVANGNIRIKDRNVDADSQLNILVNYANLTEQQIQDVLQKLETSRNGNISPCTVCSNSSSNASQRVSPLSYYANLDTAGELPPNWQPNGFHSYPELRTPRSTSSKGSTGSEFTFEVNRGSCSPVDHNYANLDTLPEVQPLRHSLSSSGAATNGAGNWMILQPPPKGKVNYIQLDFDENDQPVFTNIKMLRRSMSSSTSTTPPKTPVSPPTEIPPTVPGSKNDIYARIDIEKTVALANTHRQVEGDTDISTRRTRHDVWTENKTR